MIAPLVVWRRGEDDFLLLTEPELGDARARPSDADALRAQLRDRARGAHVAVVLGGSDGIPTRDYGLPAVEVLDGRARGRRSPTRSSSGCGSLAGTPRWGREIDDRILPAEAGLDERAISFTKGCYPGQEPLARLHYRGNVNRGCGCSRSTATAARYDAESCYEGKVVGRVTSAVPRPLSRSPTSASTCPTDAELGVGGASARALHSMTTRP